MPVSIKRALPAQADYEALMRKAAREMRELLPILREGDYDRWQDEMYSLLEKHHGQAWALGRQRGGDPRPYNQDDDLVGRRMADDQNQFLERWRKQIEDGEEFSDAQLENRANAYAMRLRGTANDAFVATQEPNELFDWVLGASEHCEDCPYMASLSPWAAEDLFTTPGSGGTKCKVNCTCKLVRRADSLAGFGPASPYEETNEDENKAA